MAFTISKRTSVQEQLATKTAARRRERQEGTAVKRLASSPARNNLLPALNVEEVPVEEIRPARRRSRKTSPEQKKRVMRSVQEFGICVPLLIDENARVVDGHILLEAAKELGLDHVPCIRVTHLSPGQLRLLRISLNRTSETGEWHLEELRVELQELDTLDLDLSITGFSMPEIDIILADPLVGEIMEDEPEPAAEPVSRAGDIWRLDDHLIICGNALEAATYERLGGDINFTAVFADPPYNCPIAGFVSGLGKAKHKDFAMGVGEMTPEAFQAFLADFLRLAAEWCIPGAVLYICMDWRQIARLHAAGADAALSLVNMAVWDKGAGGMGALYRSAHELISVFCNGDRPAVNNVELGRHGRDRTNVWHYPGANRPGSSAARELGNHPTPKPAELVRDALLDVTRRGDHVLDPFLGSGTTLIAAEECGRVCAGIELDPGYVDAAILRWERQTGKVAVHEGSGLTLEELRERRAEGAQPETGNDDDVIVIDAAA